MTTALPGSLKHDFQVRNSGLMGNPVFRMLDGMAFVVVLATVLISFGYSNAVAEERKPIIAIFSFEARGIEFKQEVLERFSIYVSGKMAASNLFQIIPQSQVNARLVQEKLMSFDDCHDESCRVELGRAFAAEKIVSGDILKMDPDCTVNLNLFDLRTDTTEIATSADGGCSEKEIIESLKRAVADLLAAESSAVTSDKPALAQVASTDVGVTDSSDEVIRKGAAGVLPNSVEFKQAFRVLGMSSAKKMVAEYNSLVEKQDPSIVMYAAGADSIQYQGFQPWVRDRLFRKRSQSLGALIVGVLSSAGGLVPIGLLAEDSSPILAGVGASLLSVGLVSMITGGVYYHRYNAALKQWDDTVGRDEVSWRSNARMFAVSPYVDYTSRGGGVQLLVGF